jgi:hypothetical protein
MEYSVKLTKYGSRPIKGKGFPECNDGGNLTLPDNPPVSAGTWLEVAVKSGAAPTRPEMGRSSIAVSPPSGTRPPRRPERFDK